MATGTHNRRKSRKPTDNSSSGGQRVRALRRQLGWSQEDLGARLTPAVSKSTVWKIETGKQLISPNLALQLAAIFDADPETLCDEPLVKNTLRPTPLRRVPFDIDRAATQHCIFLLAKKLAATLKNEEAAQRIDFDSCGLVAAVVAKELSRQVEAGDSAQAVRLHLTQFLKVAATGILYGHEIPLSNEFDRLIEDAADGASAMILGMSHP